MSFIDLFVFVSQASVLLPVAAGLANYSKLNFPFRILLWFFILCIGFEILAYKMRIAYGNNMPGLHLFTLIQFLMFSVVYYYPFRKNTVLRALVIMNAVVAIAIALADAIIINGLTNSNTISRSYTGTSIMAYTLIYLYQLFQQDSLQQQRSGPLLWFNIAALIYFANNILYFMLRGYLLAHAKDIEILCYYAYLSLNIIAHVLYTQSFRLFSKWKMES